MEAERKGAIPQQSVIDRLPQWSGTRRDLFISSGKVMSGAVAVGALGTGWKYKDDAYEAFEGRSANEEFDRYVAAQGFEKVNEPRREELLGDVSSFSALHSYETDPHNPEGITNVTFSLNEPTDVVVDVAGDYDERGSLSIVSADFKGFEYVVPILQTRFENLQTFALKTVPQGEHTIQFQKTPESKKYGEDGLTVSVKTPDNLTPFGQAVLDALPVLGMQKEFALENVYNDDAPFFRNVYLYERESDGLVRVVYFEGRVAENGGIGKDPTKMYETLGRLYDYDHSIIQTIGADGLLYAIAHQEDRFRSHRIVEEDVFSEGVDPKTIQERFLYHSVPDHGMVHRGFERKTNGELLHNKVYTLFPDFYPQIDTEVESERFRVRKLVAIREHRRETEQYINEHPEWFATMVDNGFTPQEIQTLQFLTEEEQQLMDE